MLPASTDALFARHEYPATTDQLIEAYGDHEFETTGGTETVADVLGRLSTETFHSPEDAEFAVFSALRRDAVGRVGYSDRDPAPPGTVGPDAVSF